MAEVVVGLTSYPAADGHGPHVPVEYLDAVVRAGGVPLMLPHTAGEDAGRWARAWLARVDALVLIGGGDIDPAHHRSERHAELYSVEPARDRTELALVHAALAVHRPLLAICRGLQLINVALGGSLHLHLPDAVGEAIAHRQPPRSPTPHPVRVAGDSRLASLLGERVSPMSWHHQAVERLGSGLKAVAWADDDVVEAIELDGHPQVTAVQWHPELTAAHDAAQQSLFDHLVQSARRGQLSGAHNNTGEGP